MARMTVKPGKKPASKKPTKMKKPVKPSTPKTPKKMKKPVKPSTPKTMPEQSYFV